MACGIYSIKNKTNGKIYIGQAINIKSRWRVEKWQARKGNYSAQAVTRAIHKYGEDNFYFAIIETTPLEQSILNERERYWIAFYDSCNPRKGYNETMGGQNGHFGKKRSPETCRKISSALTGKPKLSMRGRPSGMSGKTLSVEEKAKISQRLKGHEFWGIKERTDEMCKRQSLAWTTEMREAAAERGRNQLKRIGWKHTDETKKKMSEAKKGKPAANLGIPRTEEQKRKDSIIKLKRQLAKGLPCIKHTFTNEHDQICIKYYVSEWEMAKALTNGSAAVSVIREILANPEYKPKKSSIGWKILQGTLVEKCDQNELLQHRQELQ